MKAKLYPHGTITTPTFNKRLLLASVRTISERTSGTASALYIPLITAPKQDENPGSVELSEGFSDVAQKFDDGGVD